MKDNLKVEFYKGRDGKLEIKKASAHIEYSTPSKGISGIPMPIGVARRYLYAHADLEGKKMLLKNEIKRSLQKLQKKS